MKNYTDNLGYMPTRKNTGSFSIATPVTVSEEMVTDGRSKKEKEYHINSIQLLSLYF